MAAALTIAVLLAVSVSVVRVAAVAMRLTGLPEVVARFQCLSALTGTGFTTRESEMIVNYPIRRRILMALMIFGNLGLVSVAATFIVAFVDAGRDAGAIVVQAFSIAAAIAIILVMTTLKSVDRVMCAFVGAVLMKATSLARRRYQRTLQLEDDYCIAEHVIKGLEPRQLAVAGNEENALQFLALRAGETRDFRTVGENTIANPGDIVICFGTEAAHDAFEATMNRSDNVGSVA